MEASAWALCLFMRQAANLPISPVREVEEGPCVDCRKAVRVEVVIPVYLYCFSASCSWPR